MSFPARWWKYILVVVIVLTHVVFPTSVFAATSPAGNSNGVNIPLGAVVPNIVGGTGPTTSGWVESPVVTETWKGTERARQFLYWTFTHPPIYNHPILVNVWEIARNTAYFMVAITILMFAVGFYLAQRRGVPLAVNYGSIAIKIALVLLYITFSYYIILALLMLSETVMRIFIENLGGRDLLNVFAFGQNVEKNYTDFIGFWNPDPRNLEMRNTSLFLVRLTGITYNVMAIMMILRNVILFFLLILSPILALLLPFIFIRNTGWIWIGVFFQWLFYGPLFAIFLVALVKIWTAGIPYSFNFERVKKMTGAPPYDAPPRDSEQENTVFPTSINILYGGPAQELKFNNSSNYVDTYAEYIIALVMLWVVTFLPWLLLRIFRDYCCEILAQNQATLVQILDRIRGLGNPPPPPPGSGPTTTAGQAIDLPFRHEQEAPRQQFIEKLTEITRVNEINKVKTSDITQALNLSVTSIQDIAEHEINRASQTQMRTNLDALHNPASVSESELRQKFSTLRGELMTRAARGDRLAERVIAASDRRSAQVFRTQQQPAQVFRGQHMPLARPVTTPDIAKQTGVSEEQVKVVLQSIPTMGVPSSQTIQTVSQKTGVATAKVQQILSSARPTSLGRPISAPPPVSVDDYEEVKAMWLNHYRDAEVPVSEKIKSRLAWLDEDITKLTNVVNLMTSMDEKLKAKGVEEVGEILPFLLLGGFSDVETIMYLKAKLAAAQQVKTEIEVQTKAREEVEKENQEEMIDVDKTEKKEGAKTLEAHQTRQQTIPGKKDSSPTESSSRPGEEGTEDMGFRGGSQTQTLDSLKASILSSVSSIQQAATGDIARALSLQVNSLRDISLYEMESSVRESAQTNLRFLANPSTISDGVTRERYIALRTELTTRASRGDTEAQKILASLDHPLAAIVHVVPPGKMVPQLTTLDVAKQANVPESTVKKVLNVVPRGMGIPSPQTIAQAAQDTNLPEGKVEEIISLARPGKGNKQFVDTLATVDDYENVKDMWKRYYQEMDAPDESGGETKEVWLASEEKRLTNLVDALTSGDESKRKEALEKSQDIVSYFLLGGFSDIEMTLYLRAKLASLKELGEEMNTLKQAVLGNEEEDAFVDVTNKASAGGGGNGATKAVEGEKKENKNS